MSLRKYHLSFCRSFSLGILLLLACAAEDAQLKPRDLFYKKDTQAVSNPDRGQTAAVVQAVAGGQINSEGERNRSGDRLAVRYQLLLRSGERFRAVDPVTTVFHDGDAVRLRLHANQGCYLYIIQKGSSGGWTTLFPQTWMPADANRVTARQAADFPAEPGLLKFNHDAGTEEVYVVFTATREVPLDQLVQASGVVTGVPDPPQQGPAGTLMASRDLVFEQVEENDPSIQGPTTYVSFRDQSASGPVIVKIRLRHDSRSTP